MKDLETKSTNEIHLILKQLEADYEAIKTRMLNDYDKLTQIEQDFNSANLIILKRENKL